MCVRGCCQFVPTEGQPRTEIFVLLSSLCVARILYAENLHNGK